MKGTGELVTGTDQMPVQANTPFEKITVSTGSKEEKQTLSVIYTNHRICSEKFTSLQELSCLILLNSN